MTASCIPGSKDHTETSTGSFGYTEGKGISKQARQTTTDDDAVERLKVRCTGESDRRDKDKEQPPLTGTFELRTG